MTVKSSALSASGVHFRSSPTSPSTDSFSSGEPSPRDGCALWFAATYDLLAKLDESRTAPIRDFAAGGASGRVLELGCGTGLNFAHFDWSRLESLDATEPDPFMLKRARERLETLPAEQQARTRLHGVPAEALPFQDDSFDVVLTLDYVEHVADDGRCLDEVVRVLKPGGLLVLSAPSSSRFQVLNWLKCRIGMAPDVYGHVREGYGLAEMSAMLQGRGLDVVHRSTYSRFFTRRSR